MSQSTNMLLVSLDCPFMIVPSVFSNVYLLTNLPMTCSSLFCRCGLFEAIIILLIKHSIKSRTLLSISRIGRIVCYLEARMWSVYSQCKQYLTCLKYSDNSNRKSKSSTSTQRVSTVLKKDSGSCTGL